jgi:hypothetical protein
MILKVFITYFNKVSLNYEIWVIESFDKEIQTSFLGNI